MRQGVHRARADAALRRSEATLIEAQRLSATGSLSWRVATDELTRSDHAYRICDVDRARPVTFELIATLLLPDDIPAFEERVAQARHDGRDVEFEHRLQMPDRSVNYLHVVAHATRERDGQLEYIGALQDVTERRLSDEALGKARSELAHIESFWAWSSPTSFPPSWATASSFSRSS